MTGEYLLHLCKKKAKGNRPESILIRLGPFAAENWPKIENEFRELANGTIFEGLNITHLKRGQISA